MRIDIEVLNPRVVVFITLGWGDVIVKSLVGQKFNSRECAVRTWQIDGRLIIACKRPEGRSEDSLAKCICTTIDEFIGAASNA